MRSHKQQVGRRAQQIETDRPAMDRKAATQAEMAIDERRHASPPRGKIPADAVLHRLGNQLVGRAR